MNIPKPYELSYQLLLKLFKNDFIDLIMRELSKVLLLLIAAITGILALLMGNDPFAEYYDVPNNGPNTDPTLINISEDNDLPESNLNIIPTQVLGDELIKHRYYTLSYSSHHQNAEWVAYELRGDRLDLPNGAERPSFKSDPATESAAKNSDYNKTGYDRGHLAPAHDMDFNKTAMEESFYMTNVSPQVPDFNRGIWKSLETKVRKWAKQEKRLYVVTGPLLRKRVSKDARMTADGPSIPKGFYKIILDYDEPQKKGIAFMFKNKASDQPLKKFVATIDLVEEYTGLDFFPDLSKKEQKELEGQSNPDLWDFE